MVHISKIFKFKNSTEPGKIPLDTIRQYLPPNPIVFEAGAHIGSDTTEMAENWPDAEIYAFEPIPKILKQLESNTKRFKSIHCYKLAIGEKSGRMKIHVSGGDSDGSSSILEPKEHLSLHPNVTFSKQIPVEVKDIDSWVKSEKLTTIDFLWLDLQGYELAALRGAKKILQNVSAIHCEVNLVEVYKGAPLYSDLKKWLEEYGFRVEIEAIDWDDGGNVLFVKDKHASS